MELQAHKASLINLRADLRERSFVSLWGNWLAMPPDEWTINNSPIATEDCLLLKLDPHLQVLRDGFALPDATADSAQLDLFSLPNLHRLVGQETATKSDQRRSA